jgi:hypothetical protein
MNPVSRIAGRYSLNGVFPRPGGMSPGGCRRNRTEIRAYLDGKK